jgi:hypothetical protein
MKWVLALYVLFPGEAVGELDPYKETPVASYAECRQALRIVTKEMASQDLDFQWYGVCHDKDAPIPVYTYMTMGIDKDPTVKKYATPVDGDKE